MLLESSLSMLQRNQQMRPQADTMLLLHNVSVKDRTATQQAGS